MNCTEWELIDLPYLYQQDGFFQGIEIGKDQIMVFGDYEYPNHYNVRTKQRAIGEMMPKKPYMYVSMAPMIIQDDMFCMDTDGYLMKYNLRIKEWKMITGFK